MQKRQQEQSQSAEKIQLLETGKIVIPPGPRLGERVISVHGIKKSFEGRVLFEKLSFELVSAALHSDTFSQQQPPEPLCLPCGTTGAWGNRGCDRRERVRKEYAFQHPRRACGELRACMDSIVCALLVG